MGQDYSGTWMQAAAGAAQGALGIGFQRIGMGYDRRQQMKTQTGLTEIQKAAQKEMMDYQQQKDLEMWEKTGYSAQMRQLTEAGLNPGLIYGMSGGGGQSIGHGGATAISGGTAQHVNTTAMGIQSAAQMALMMSQKKVLDTQAEKNAAEAEKISGADTENIKADTANKVLTKIILDYTGKDAARTFDKIKSPNTSIEAKTYEDELAARQGIAGTIYEMWQEGKLHEKATGEIEQVLLNNAKTRAEKVEIMNKIDLLEQNIKGAKLDNIIKELETKLQTETGIDRNSPAWIKILGRLFVQLFNK